MPFQSEVHRQCVRQELMLNHDTVMDEQSHNGIARSQAPY